MISYVEDGKKFNYRVGAIIKKDNKILLHRLSKFDFWLLPGGRVEMLENTENAIVRELEEEINVKSKVEGLAFSSETFFKLGNTLYHELGFYYFTKLEDEKLYQKEEFYGEEGEEKLIYKWFDINELESIDLRPEFLVEYFKNPSTEYKHIIKSDL